MLKKLGISLVFAVLIGAVLLVLQQALGLDIAGTPRPAYLLAAVATHFMSLSLIAWRLQLSLADDRRHAFVSFLDMTVLHNFLLAFLPARMADAYYPFLVAARSRGNLGAGIGNLILLRLLDLTAIGVLVGAVLPWVVKDGLKTEALLGFLALTLMVAVALVTMLAPLLAAFLNICRRLTRGSTMGRKLFRLLNQARHWIGTQSPTRLLTLFAASLALWSSSSLTYFVVFRGLGLDLNLPRSVFAGQLTELSAALPIQTVAGMGAGEGVMTAVLTGYGLPIGAAAVTAVWSRLTILGIVTVSFTVRAGLLSLRNRNNVNSMSAKMPMQELLLGRADGVPIGNSRTGIDAKSDPMAEKPAS